MSLAIAQHSSCPTTSFFPTQNLTQFPRSQEPPTRAIAAVSYLLPVREQAKRLLLEEGSLVLGCSWGLGLPALPGDVRGGRWRASGRQAEAIAVQEEE